MIERKQKLEGLGPRGLRMLAPGRRSLTKGRTVAVGGAAHRRTGAVAVPTRTMSSLDCSWSPSWWL